MHRRARALRKIAQVITTESMKSETVVSYLLPLATIYITDDSYSKSQSMLDAAIEMIGAASKCLPWPRYLLLLKHYLALLTKNLEKQKLMVR